MNILQQEDVVKGLADDRLMQEAKAPTGQVPQFLVVSEIQRRTDMRKRHAAQQEQPEGTVAEQIMQEGLGSLQAPPQMPNPLPTGQGIAPNPNQPPPPQPPNAQMAPQGGGGYAAGGIVRMSGLSGNSSTNQGMYGSQNAYGNNAYIPNDMDYAKYAELISSGMSPEEAQNALITGGANMTPSGGAPGVTMPALPDSRLGGRDRLENNVGFVDLGIPDSAEEYVAPDAYTGPQKSDSFSEYPSMIAGQGKPATAAEMHPEGKKQGDWYDPAVSGITNLIKWRGGRGSVIDAARSQMQNAGPAEAQGSDVDYTVGGSDGSYDLNALAQDSNYDPDYTAMTDEEFARDVAAESNGIVDVAADKSPEVAAAINKPTILGSNPKSDAQRADAEGVVEKGGKSGNTSDALSKLIESQRNMAWSNAIIQLGAGIAGGDLSGGLSAMGDSMAAGQSQVNQTTQQKLRQDWSDEQQERQLAQRRSEVEAGYGYGGRGGDPAKVQSAKWFLSLDEKTREMVMKYEGREMPQDIVKKLIAKVITDPSDGIARTPEEIAGIEAQLNTLYRITGKPGATPQTAIPAEQLNSEPESGTWVLFPGEERPRQIP